MDKQIIGIKPQVAAVQEEDWLDLERSAQVRLGSEDPQFPIESALVPGEGPGWRAAAPGAQTISLHFYRPQAIRRICLLFVEEERQRVQEFVLRWSSEEGNARSEIVRQQYVFSPPTTTREVEEYKVNLDNVLTLELSIVPDKSSSNAFASLRRLRLA